MDSVNVRELYGGARLTKPREIIARCANELNRAFTIEELAAIVRKTDPSAGSPATVYRAVAALTEAGHVKRVGERDGAALYAVCTRTRTHHHHVVCDGCGRIAHAACPLPDPASDTASGFVITRHEVTLYGLCPTCASDSSPIREER